MRKLTFITATLALIVSASMAEPIQWEIADGGNDHWYDVIYTPGGITWAQAQSAAISAGGYLATVTSAGENDFIWSTLVDDPQLWFIDGANNNEGPFIGGFQLPGSPEPAEGWQWVTEEAFGPFTAWRSGEPNNAGGSEECLVYFCHGSGRDKTWNDVPSGSEHLGYVVEYNVPEPATMGLLAFGGLTIMRRRS